MHCAFVKSGHSPSFYTTNQHRYYPKNLALSRSTLMEHVWIERLEAKGKKKREKDSIIRGWNCFKCGLDEIPLMSQWPRSPRQGTLSPHSAVRARASARQCERHHLSVFVTLCVCVKVRLCLSTRLCVRPESKTARLVAALKSRVIDKYRLPGFFQTNYHRIGSSRQPVRVRLTLLFSCAHIHTATSPALLHAARLTCMIYGTSGATKDSSITPALVFWKPNSTTHWFTILNTWAESDNQHSCSHIHVGGFLQAL